MRIGRARELAAEWVATQPATGLVGAFFAGSSVDLRSEHELAPDSDIDLVLVMDGDAPAKVGKLTHAGVRLDVSYLSLADVSDPDSVARVHWLAPSFRGGAIIADPTGVLSRVEAQVSRVFAEPEVVRERLDTVAGRLQTGLDSWSAAGSWPARVMYWVFPASLTTHLVLVAGLRNPTVRLRYRAARDLLRERGLAERGGDELYPVLLDHLGVRDLTPADVAAQVPAVAQLFDAAAAVNANHFPFASDLTPDARNIAIEGSERLIAAGDHREVVFWLVATLVRAQLILDHDGPPRVAARWAEVSTEAVAALTGLRTEADLVRRTAVVREALPRVRAVAEELVVGNPARPRFPR